VRKPPRVETVRIDVLQAWALHGTAGCVAIYFRATSRSMNSVLVDAS